MENEELLDAIIAEIGRLPMRGSAEQKTAPRPKGRDVARTLAQGATLGGADEIEAGARSLLGGDEYGAILDEIRNANSQYREDFPSRAIAQEMAGAAIPSVLSLGATTPANARFLPTAMRASGLGIAEGSAYGFLSGDGGDADTYWGQALNRTPNAAKGGVVGAFAGPLGVIAARGGGRAIAEILDRANRTFGPRMGKLAEKELARVIEESGLTVDDVVEGLENGKIMAEIMRNGNKTLQTIARGYYAKSRGAASVLDDGLTNRPKALREDTMKYLQDTMSDGTDPNVLRQFNAADDTLRREASADYNRVFDANAGPVSGELQGVLIDAYRRVPAAKKDLDKLARAKGDGTPFFKEVDGKIEFTRPPNLQEAEIMRRAVKSSATREFSTGGGVVGAEYKGIERGLRGEIDAASPELADVRKKWSQIETAKEAFDEGRKALSKSPDEVEIAWSAATEKGDAAAKAYRAGLVDAYRRKGSTGSAKSLPGYLANEERKEGAILRIVFPGDDLEAMLGKAQRAADSQAAKNEILGGTQTAITEGRKDQIGSGFLQDALEATAGSPTAGLRVAGQVLKGMRPGLTDKDIQQVAKMMVETNPAVFRQMAEGANVSDQLVRLADSALRRLESAGSSAFRRAVQPAQQGILGSF